jgi:hypothetical protein
MKSVKLTKKMLTLSPGELLIKLRAVNKELKQAYPQHVYFSKEDYKNLRANTRKLLKKEYPYINSRKLNTAVGMELLNLGPNEGLKDAIRPGYALVDEEAIEKEE